MVLQNENVKLLQMQVQKKMKKASQTVEAERKCLSARKIPTPAKAQAMKDATAATHEDALDHIMSFMASFPGETRLIELVAESAQSIQYDPYAAGTASAASASDSAVGGP